MDTTHCHTLEAPPATSHLPHPTLATAMTSLELREHLEGLPQELYDEILKLTFTCSNNITRIEPRSEGSGLEWLPPRPTNLLQVSSGTRARFAALYYGSTTFRFRSMSLIVPWIEQIAPDHRPLPRDLQCYHSPTPPNATVAIQIGRAISCIFQDGLLKFIKGMGLVQPRIAFYYESPMEGSAEEQRKPGDSVDST